MYFGFSSPLRELTLTFRNLVLIVPGLLLFQLQRLFLMLLVGRMLTLLQSFMTGQSFQMTAQTTMVIVF